MCNDMKRVISILLMIVIILVNTTVVLADTGTSSKKISGKNEKVVIDVEGEYTSQPETIYSVEISWGNMEFQYEMNGSYNPSTHDYNSTSSDIWNIGDMGNIITVKNHSNTDISATLNYSKTLNTVIGTFKDTTTGGNVKNTLNAKTAIGTMYANVPNDSAYLQLNCNPEETFNTLDDNTLGTVTVEILGYNLL